MQFYDLKTREHVAIDDAKVTKTTYVRQTKAGTQTRYAIKAHTEDGTPLTKFINKATYDALDVPVEPPKTK